MNTEEFKLLLPDYLTGMLKGEQADKVSEAISSDPELKELYNEFLTAARIMSDTVFPERDDEYWKELSEQINAKIRSWENRKTWSSISYRFFAAAAVILLIITGYFNRDLLIEYFSASNTKEVSVKIPDDSLKTKYSIPEQTQTDTSDFKNKKITLKEKRKIDQTDFKEEPITQSNDESYEETNIENLFNEDTENFSDELEGLTKEEEEKLIEEIIKSSL